MTGAEVKSRLKRDWYEGRGEDAVRVVLGSALSPLRLSPLTPTHLVPVVVQALRGEAGPHVEPKLGQGVDGVLVEEVAAMERRGAGKKN